MSYGTLYLIPTGLGGEQPAVLLPPSTLSVVHKLDHFIVENAKSARAFLKAVHYPRPLQSARIVALDKHAGERTTDELLSPLIAGSDVGVMSEAGCPGVADPGAGVVRAAHNAGITVQPLVGPSAILLALMASGLNGQRFRFHGYLPVDDGERTARLHELERLSAMEDTSQIFIETPYRNDALMVSMLSACRPDTWLCVAADLTLPTQTIRTSRIGDWKTRPPRLDRRPAVFILYRGAN